MKNLLISIVILGLSGCASAGYNGLCGRVTVDQATVPYVAGKANLDGYACHIGYVGRGTPDYSALEAIMTHYVDMQTTDGKLTVTGPGTVQFVPNK